MREVATVVIGVTSAAAIAVGAGALRWPLASLRTAAVRMLEAVGIVALFAVANAAVALLLVFAARMLLNEFVSLYVVRKGTWLVLSLMQGLMFHWWWRSRRCAATTPSSPDHTRPS